MDRGVRPQARCEAGFTLVELLVVMLILGILATIAIPSFINQKDKAHDAKAKSAAKTAATAAETLATDNGGLYSGPGGVSTANMRAIEPTLVNVDLRARGVSATGFTVRVISDSGNRFDLTRTATGTYTTRCAPRNSGGCPRDRTWD